MSEIYHKWKINCICRPISMRQKQRELECVKLFFPVCGCFWFAGKKTETKYKENNNENPNACNLVPVSGCNCFNCFPFDGAAVVYSKVTLQNGVSRILKKIEKKKKQELKCMKIFPCFNYFLFACCCYQQEGHSSKNCLTIYFPFAGCC